MAEYTALFERAAARYSEPQLSTEGLFLRRDHKQRNQRVAAGLFGIAVFAVAAIGLVRLLGSEGTPAPATSEPPTTASPSVFTEIAPGEFVEIPDWPLGERTTPPMVWTGAELIVWGDGIYGSAGDGAAFDLANGTWRVIAEAPISPRGEHAAAWTGTEMIVWGGRVENSFYYDGAAYNPVTDAWRLLPSAPVGFDARDPIMVWTGNEAVVLGQIAAAYDPVRDSWRTLANPPFGVHGFPAWWTGDSIVVAEVGYDPESDRMARYDLAADRWTTVDSGASAALVGVPGSDGNVSTFLSLPSETGAPVRLIDGTGRLIAELPAFPGEPGVFGDEIGASGVWVGSEAVFEIWKVASDYEPEQLWALNPGTQEWRRLDGGKAFPRVNDHAVAAGDLLLLWNRPSDRYQGPPTTPRVCCVAPPSSGGSIYRISTTSPSEVP